MEQCHTNSHLIQLAPSRNWKKNTCLSSFSSRVNNTVNSTGRKKGAGKRSESMDIPSSVMIALWGFFLHLGVHSPVQFSKHSH